MNCSEALAAGEVTEGMAHATSLFPASERLTLITSADLSNGDGQAGLRNRSDSTSSHQLCPIAMWHSWMRAVFAAGTVTQMADARARRPPSLPERPMVLRFCFLACFIAASTL